MKEIKLRTVNELTLSQQANLVAGTGTGVPGCPCACTCTKWENSVTNGNNDHKSKNK